MSIQTDLTKIIPQDIISEIQKETTDYIKANFYKAAANLVDSTEFPLPSDISSFEHIAVKFLKNLPADKNESVKKFSDQAASIFRSNSIDKMKLFGSFGKINFHGQDSIEKQTNNFKERMPKLERHLRVSGPKFTRHENRFDVDKSIKGRPDKIQRVSAHGPEKQNRSESKKIHLKLVNIKCKNDGSEVAEVFSKGGLKIELAGFGISSEKEKIRAKLLAISTDFKTGTTYTFNNDKNYISFKWENNENYPKVVGACLFMCEVDGGGFADFIDAAWNHLDTVVTKLVAQIVASTSTGAAIGSVIPGIGTAIGIAVGAAIGEFINSLKDDIFKPGNIHIMLTNDNDLFENNRLESPVYTLKFQHKKVEFQLEYKWEIEVIGNKISSHKNISELTK